MCLRAIKLAVMCRTNCRLGTDRRLSEATATAQARKSYIWGRDSRDRKEEKGKACFSWKKETTEAELVSVLPNDWTQWRIKGY